MRKMLAIALLPMLAGCLTSSDPDASHWVVSYVPQTMEPAASPKYGVARVVQVTVRSPYVSDNLVVLRADGSVAFDAYNLHAAPPAQLLRGAVYDAMVQSGLFKEVVNASSTVSSSVSAEVLVTKLALDCTCPETGRCATVDLVVRLVSDGELVATAKASATVGAAQRNFGAAFSLAVSSALESAFGQLR